MILWLYREDGAIILVMIQASTVPRRGSSDSAWALGGAGWRGCAVPRRR